MPFCLKFDLIPHVSKFSFVLHLVDILDLFEVKVLSSFHASGCYLGRSSQILLFYLKNDVFFFTSNKCFNWSLFTVLCFCSWRITELGNWKLFLLF